MCVCVRERGGGGDWSMYERIRKYLLFKQSRMAKKL